MGVVVVFNAFREGPAADKGLGGRLETRPSPRGGWGKELMLTDFRNVLPAALTPARAFGCGRGKAVVGAGEGGGRKVEEGALRPVLGVLGVDLLGESLELGDVGAPVLFRVFGTGNAGRATVGGPIEGLEGRGSPVDMMRAYFRAADVGLCSGRRRTEFLCQNLPNTDETGKVHPAAHVEPSQVRSWLSGNPAAQSKPQNECVYLVQIGRVLRRTGCGGPASFPVARFMKRCHAPPTGGVIIRGSAEHAPEPASGVSASDHG